MKTFVSAVAVLAVAGVASASTYGPGPGGALVDFAGGVPGVFTSVLNISDNGGIIGDISVELLALSHTWGGDLQISLTSPAGTMLDLVNRVGFTGSGFGDSSDYGADYTFANGGADLWAAFAAAGAADIVPGGVYAATGALNASVDLSAFAGENINGDWTLTITDFAGGDTGSLGGWTLNATIPTPGAVSLLGLAGLAAVRRRR
jgi:uncharacterized protein (TIGR03382 family)